MAVAPEINKIGMLQLKAVSAAFEAPDEKARDGISKKLLDDIEPLVLSIFKKYATAGQSFWGPEEAAIFFGHYAEHFPHIEVTLATKEMAGKTKLKNDLEAIAMVQKLRPSFMRAGAAEGDAAQIRKMTNENTEKFEEQKKTTKEGMSKQLLSYQENKKERNEEAFKFLDANKDQKIEVSEFMAAMQPGGNKNFQLIGALGLDDGEKPLKTRSQGAACFWGICEIIDSIIRQSQR